MSLTTIEQQHFRRVCSKYATGITILTVLDSRGACLYSGKVPADRPVDHYTPRILPSRDGVRIPLEVGLITWQK